MTVSAADLFTSRADMPTRVGPEELALASKAPPLDVGEFSTMFPLGYKAERAQLPDWVNSRVSELTDDFIDRAQKAGGTRLASPFAMVETPANSPNNYDFMKRLREAQDSGQDPSSLLPPTFEQRWAKFSVDAGKLRQRYPDLPDPGTFRDQALGELRGRIAAFAAAQKVSTGLGDIGGLLGSGAGQMVHPLMLATLPLGIGAPSALYAPVRGGLTSALGRILAVGGTEALINAGLQLPISLEKMQRLPSEGVPYNFGNVVDDLMGAGTFGFAMGGGFRALLAGWRGLRGTPAARAALSPVERLHADDAAMVGERLVQEELDLAPPAAVHEATIAMATGRAPDVAPILRAEEAARADELTPRVEAKPEETTAASAAPVTRPADTSPIFTASGRRIEARYSVQELRNFIPSHTDDLKVNAAYPPELQPRDRTRAASEAQVAEIAAKLEPERLGKSTDASTGAPIVGPDNVVESGNGRVLALRKMYAENAERVQAYRDWLASQGYDVSGMKNPALIAERRTPLNEAERQAFVREANEAPASRMGASEQAMVDAKALGKVLDLYKGGDARHAMNRDFVTAFVKGLGQSERTALITKSGEVAAAGMRRLENALVAAAYGDRALIERLAEDADPGSKSIGGALLDVAGQWAQMRAAALRGEISPHTDATADLIAATRFLEDARAKGESVADRLAQADFISAPTDAQVAFLAMLHKDGVGTRIASRQAIGDRLKSYVDEAMRTKPGVDLLGDTAPAPKQIMDTILNKQRELFKSEEELAVERPKPDAVRAADVLEAQRALEAKDQPVPAGVGPDGETVYKSGRKMMAEAEEAEKAAAKFAECATGVNL